MGGGKGLSGQVKSNLGADANALTSIAGQQQNQATQLFQSAFPGQVSAENFYQSLASGDPTQIARAISPATQQIGQATAGAKQNILNNDPSGGEKNLALEQTNVNQGAQVGSTASQGYLNSFNALAKLAGQGIGESQNSTNSAISGFGSSANVNQNLGQLQIQQKGANLGAFGGLLGDATGLGTSMLGGKGGAGGGGGGGGLGIGQILGAQSAGATGGLSPQLPDLSSIMV